MVALHDSLAVNARFDAICSLVTAARGRGPYLEELGTVYSLARTLDVPDPEADRVQTLCALLGIPTPVAGAW